jgi:mono/diheme cytochrome c family protein
MVTEGDSIYHARGCRNCHGMDAKGAANGPALITTKFMHVDGSYNDFVRVITAGIPATAIKDPAHRIPMPAMGGNRPAPLTDAQVKSVAAYVYSLNHP